MKRGLTLIEVLVALVLCTAGIVVVSGAISQCLLTEGRAAERELAADLLEGLLSQLSSGEQTLASASGTFEDVGFPEISWSVEVDPGEIEGLVEARCAVLWTSSTGPASLELQRSYFQDPIAGGTLR